MAGVKSRIKNIGKLFLLHGLFPAVYRMHCIRPVKKGQVLFLEIRYAELSNNFTLLYEEFCKKEAFHVKVSFLGNSVFSFREYISRCLKMLGLLAGSEIVFVNESSNVLAALPVRSQTKLVQTWHGCGAFKRFGYDGVTELKERYYNDYLFTTVSSEEVVDIYAKSMGQERSRVLPIGVSRTDVFFDRKYVEGCRERIMECFGIGSGKKIVLYAPTFRGNVGAAQSPRLFNPSVLYGLLGEEYVVLYKGHPAVRVNWEVPKNCSHCYKDASGEPIEALLCAADLCVTDYSSLIFEFALLERPMYFYAYDYELYSRERGFYYPLVTFLPGPVCRTEVELAQAILHPSPADLQRVREFREKFMSACDGHATQRIMERLAK